MKTRLPIHVLAAAAIAFATAYPVAAQFIRARANPCGLLPGNCDQLIESTSAATVGPLVHDFGFATGTAAAACDFGVLRLSAGVDAAADGVDRAPGAHADAAFTIDDLAISGTADPGAELVASLRFRVRAAFSATSAVPSAGSAEMLLGVSPPSTAVNFFGIAHAFGAAGGGVLASGILAGHATGTFSDALIDAAITTPAFAIVPGPDQRLAMSLVLSTAARTVQSDSSGRGRVEVYFVPGERVFDLPPGFTADSVQGRIVDNIFLGSTLACPGDTNCDQRADFFDIDPFLLALFSPAEYEILFPDCSLAQADLNADASVDFFDVDPFVTRILNGTCP